MSIYRVFFAGSYIGTTRAKSEKQAINNIRYRIGMYELYQFKAERID